MKISDERLYALRIVMQFYISDYTIRNPIFHSALYNS